MFQCLLDAIQSVEESKREVELRIKARAQEVREQLEAREAALATSNGQPVPTRPKSPRPHRKGRTMYTSGSRFLNR